MKENKIQTSSENESFFEVLFRIFSCTITATWQEEVNLQRAQIRFHA
jgi:hypothetical protein